MPKNQQTIMFVEDDADHQKLYKIVFEKAGYNLAQVFQGKETVAKARIVEPDLILLDILMNDTNGIDVLKELKADPELKKIPVIIFTNYSREETLKEALKIGAAEIVFKTDVVPKELVALVQKKYLKS